MSEWCWRGDNLPNLLREVMIDSGGSRSIIVISRWNRLWLTVCRGAVCCAGAGVCLSLGLAACAGALWAAVDLWHLVLLYLGAVQVDPGLAA